MKKLALALLLLCQFSFAMSTSIEITASGGSPIPIAYSVSNSQSAALKCQAPNGVGGWPTHLYINNQTGVEVRVILSKTLTSPATPSANEIAIPTLQGIVLDGFPIADGATLFLRSASGSTITSGSVILGCY